MLVWLTLPFYDFCGFRSVAVNSVYKLQFFTFIAKMATYPVLYALYKFTNLLTYLQTSKEMAAQTGHSLPTA